MIEYNEFYLTLVRHGQSTTNQNPDLIGQQADTPLSQNGEEQAWHLGERLAAERTQLDRVFSSTYTRAHDTAKIALSHFCNPPEIQLAYDLREYSAGDWTNASRKDTIILPVQARMGLMAHGFLPPNGESLHQVERRASLWVEENILYNKDIIEEAKSRNAAGGKPQNIFCFSHGMTIKCLINYIMGGDRGFTWKIKIDNTSLTKFYFGSKGWELLGINDFSHLRL